MSFVKNKIEAAQVINAAICSHRESWNKFLATERYLIDCEPPFDDKLIKDQGDHVSNWNFGKGRSKVQKIAGENTTEITQAISLCEVEFERFSKEKHKDNPLYEFLIVPEKRNEYSERIATCFSEVIAESESMLMLIRRAELESLLSGYSSVVGDKSSIFPVAVPYTSIGFEDHTPINNVGTFVIFDIIKGSTIFNLYKDSIKSGEEQLFGYEDCGVDPPSFSKNGWNPKVLGELVCNIFNANREAIIYLNGKEGLSEIKEEDLTRRFMGWEDISMLASKMGMNWMMINTSNRKIAKIYQLTSQGTLHETYCFISSGNLEVDGNTSFSSVEYNIAYYHKKENVSQDDFIVLVKDSTIDGSLYIHDIKGSGRIIAENALRYDIFRNGLITSATLNNTTWVKMNGGITSSTVKPITMTGGVTVIDENIELVQRIYQQNITDSVNMLQIEEQEARGATSHIESNRQLSNRPNKDEVALISSEADAIRKTDIPYKLKAYSKIVSMVMLNVINDEFVKTVPRDRLLIEQFKNAVYEEFSDTDLTTQEIDKILKCVTRVNISPVLLNREAISQAMNMASTSSSRTRLSKMFLASFGFTRRQIKGIIEIDDYGRHAELAAIENSMFEKTKEVVFSLGQDHITHLQAHFYKLEAKFKDADAGDDPVVIFNFANNCIPNCELHVRAITNSPFFRNKAKDYIDILNLFKRSLKSLAQKLDQAKNQQQNNGQSSLSAKEQAELALEREKMIYKIQMSSERAKAMQELKISNFNLDQELKKIRAQAELDMKKQKTDVDINSSLAKKATEMI